MVEGVNDLVSVGRLAVIVSLSAAVQVPVPQPAPVLVTPDGTDMNAVLVTCVWAKAGSWKLIKNRSAHR
jgi:hypothetical protein